MKFEDVYKFLLNELKEQNNAVDATLKGDPALLRLADPQTKNTLLHNAIITFSDEKEADADLKLCTLHLIIKLISQGTNIFLENKKGETAVDLMRVCKTSIKSGDDEMPEQKSLFETVLAALMRRIDNLSESDILKINAIAKGSDLFSVIRQEQQALDFAAKPTFYNLTPLQLARLNGHYDCVQQYFSEKKAIDINGEGGLQPLSDEAFRDKKNDDNNSPSSPEANRPEQLKPSPCTFDFNKLYNHPHITQERDFFFNLFGFSGRTNTYAAIVSEQKKKLVHQAFVNYDGTSIAPILHASLDLLKPGSGSRKIIRTPRGRFDFTWGDDGNDTECFILISDLLESFHIIVDDDTQTSDDNHAKIDNVAPADKKQFSYKQLVHLNELMAYAEFNPVLLQEFTQTNNPT